MNFLKQNSDYALRIMASLGQHSGPKHSVSAKKLAELEDISEQFTAKILQKLSKAGLVESEMGAKGGYRISKKPHQISMLDVIKTMQGPLALNHCSPAMDTCPRKPTCPIAKFVCLLEEDIAQKLSSITIKDIIENDNLMKGNKNDS